MERTALRTLPVQTAVGPGRARNGLLHVSFTMGQAAILERCNKLAIVFGQL